MALPTPSPRFHLFLFTSSSLRLVFPSFCANQRQIFNAILGWNNTATLGSVLSYVFYWIAIMVVLVYLKWKEGRISFFGFKSAVATRREEKQHEAYHTGGYEAGARIEEKKSRHGEGETPSAEGEGSVPVLEGRV